MRIALAQINTTVGDFSGNTARILDAAEKARIAGARLVAFPELAVSGYPPRDLLLQPTFVQANLDALAHLERRIEGIAAVIGFVERHSPAWGRGLRNAAAVVADGRRIATARKQLLPTYDIFDEDRYFDPADETTVFEWEGRRIALTVCEDIWNDPAVLGGRRYPRDPVESLVARRPDLVLNLSASHFTLGKWPVRFELGRRAARRTGSVFAYVNLCGGNDESVFDGASFAVAPGGELAARARSFSEDLLVVETEGGPGRIEPLPESEAEQALEALTLGLRDYVVKCGFRDVVIGLSGGIDSALVAALAADALGPDRVLGISMPSRFSSAGSVEDSRALAANLGIAFETIPIESIYSAFLLRLDPLFQGTGFGVAEENLQARIRGMLLMAVSNKFGRLLLTTGNKSEIAVGYATLYGDMAGGLAVLSDLLKTRVYSAARAFNRRRGQAAIPEAIFSKPPSAELRPDQKDTDSLPPYDILDPILQAYVVEERGRDALLAGGFDAATVDRVIRMVDANEYKRRQAPLGLKISDRAFGIGRRIPIARRFVPVGP